MSLQEVFASRDVDAFLDLLDPDVVWTWRSRDVFCRNREEVKRTVEEALAQGRSGQPQVVAEAGDRVIVDPHADSPPDFAPELHQVFSFGGGKIVRIDDYPDRASAFEAVGLA